MKILILSIFIFSTSFSTSHAENNKPKYSLPKNSQLTFKENKTGFYYFKGEVKISGKYEIQAHEHYSHLIMTIYPDKKSLKLLPSLNLYGDSKQLPIKIQVSNTEETTPLIINKQIDDYLYRNSEATYGNAVFTINNFAGGYECDQLTFIAKIKKTTNINASKKYKKIKGGNGC